MSLEVTTLRGKCKRRLSLNASEEGIERPPLDPLLVGFHASPPAPATHDPSAAHGPPPISPSGQPAPNARPTVVPSARWAAVGTSLRPGWDRRETMRTCSPAPPRARAWPAAAARR